MKYIAIIDDDLAGPVWGIGSNEKEARTDAGKWGFPSEEGVAVEITRSSYKAIEAGNPDAFEPLEFQERFDNEPLPCKVGALTQTRP